MAAKVQLMKLKMRAKGVQSLPQDERVYLKVLLPRESHKGQSSEVFVSKLWSMGRVVDAVAELSKVPNKNNVSGAAKLRLFRFQDGLHLTEDFEKTVAAFVEAEELFNGDSVILEYVKDGEECQVEPKLYK